MPVPPPTIAIGDVTEPLQPRQRHHGQQRSDVQARRRRIEPDVRGHALRGEQLRQPFGGVVHHARATSARRRDWRRIRHRGNRVTIPVDGGHSARGPQDAARHGRRRASRAPARTGILYERHAARGHARRRAGRRPAAGARRPAHRLDHRRAPQPLGVARGCRSRRRHAHERAPRPHRARRRLRHLGRSAATSGRPPRRSRRSRRRTASSRILGNHDDDHDMPAALASARRPGAQGRADAADDPPRAARSGRASASGRSGRPTSRRVVRGASADDDPARARSAPADRSRGAEIPLVLSGHTHGGQVVLPVVGAVAAQKFPVVAGHRAGAETTTMFVSRGVGTVYVPVTDQLPAGSRGA